jgi:tetratricopeptide (TPR) repeat protein
MNLQLITIFTAQDTRSLLNKGLALRDLGGRTSEAIALFQQVIDLYGPDPDLAMRERVAHALLAQGIEFSRLPGGRENAIRVFQRLVNSYGTEPRSGVGYEAQWMRIKHHVAEALCNMGDELADLGQSAPARAAYEEVVKRYRDTDDSTLHALVRRAASSLGDL